jgi:hypothetical protein
MIELLNDIYIFAISGIAISFLIAALFVWYCINKDMKEREAFDEKYRRNRDVENKWDR